jgi:hypothetical protein
VKDDACQPFTNRVDDVARHERPRSVAAAEFDGPYAVAVDGRMAHAGPSDMAWACSLAFASASTSTSASAWASASTPVARPPVLAARAGAVAAGRSFSEPSCQC